MSWRPEEWDKYRQEYGGVPPRGGYEEDEAQRFEAGADAMLEALRSRAKNLTDGCGNINSIYKYVRIPDDE